MQDGDIPAEAVRKILHVDQDCFYASVEVRDDPSLRGRPVAVGGERERGVVAAANYEARAFGVHSAMASVTARRLCPELVFVKPRMDVYREVSSGIRAIFFRHTALVEPLSLDEAYLDVTENLQGLPTATAVARAIRAEIREETGLTASAGVSYCRFLAKMASGHRKPDGLTVITPEQGPAFVEALPVAKFHGVGPATAARLHAMGVTTGADLKRLTLEELTARFGKQGFHFHQISRGIDTRPVNPDRERKSAGAEVTFASDFRSLEDLTRELEGVADKAWDRIRRAGAEGRTVTLKVKFDDFKQVTRSRSLARDVSDRDEMFAVARALLEAEFPLARGVRLLGVTLSGLQGREAEAPAASSRQLELAL